MTVETRQACIRAPHAVWTTCTCSRCAVDRRRMAKLQRHGRYRRVPSSAAWDVLDRLRAAEWSCAAIATATGIPRATVTQALRKGRDGWSWGPRHSHAIVTHGIPTHGQIGAHGTRRRLQALAAIGWTLQALADRSGIRFSTLASIRKGVTTRVGVPLAHTIAEMYEQLCMTPGGSLPARRHAAGQGWPAPLAWDDIDDPGASPDTGGPVDHRTSSLVEDLEYLLDTDGPWTWVAITARLGVTKSAIEHACGPKRGQRRDLLERIHRADRGIAA